MAERYSAVSGFRCLTCDRRYDFAPMLTGCPECQGLGRPAILDPEYDYAAVDPAVLAKDNHASLWGYHQLLPVPSETAVVSLGEGQTPLILVQSIARRTGAAEVWVKYEAVNPTHSFKDRANSVAVSVARYFDYDKVTCTSTGNHGVALSAYAARAGLRALNLVPPGAPPAAVAEMRFFGAGVVTVLDGDIIPILERLVLDHGWYPSQRNAAGVGGRKFGNPFGMEGYKTLSYEVFTALGQRSPDWLFAPIGGGDGGWGFIKGFRELRELGLSALVPRLAACQSAAGAPLVRAMLEGLPTVQPVPTRPTIAFSIVDSQTGDHALRAIRESDGIAVAVTDEQIRQAEGLLSNEGICVEPASAAALAGLLKSADSEPGKFDGAVVVLVATGAGTRWPSTFVEHGASAEVHGSIDELAAVVRL
jgi:threonine synthase